MSLLRSLMRGSPPPDSIGIWAFSDAHVSGVTGLLQTAASHVDGANFRFKNGQTLYAQILRFQGQEEVYQFQRQIKLIYLTFHNEQFINNVSKG